MCEKALMSEPSRVDQTVVSVRGLRAIEPSCVAAETAASSPETPSADAPVRRRSWRSCDAQKAHDACPTGSPRMSE